MPDNVSLATFKALLPPGPIWQPAEGGDFDLLLQGMADNSESVAEFLRQLAYVRNPFKTPYLDELEREYGITPNLVLSEETRRMQLATRVYQREGSGSADDLQTALRSAGFDVYVHTNDPAIDPAAILSAFFLMYCESPNAYAGRPDAVAGQGGGELLVNGDIFTQRPDYLMICGGDISFAGRPDAVAGKFDNFSLDPVFYQVPTDPKDWPFVFFVGGVATRDASGFITGIQQADIPSSQEKEFKRIILRIKPIFTWAGLVVNYT